MNFEEDTVQPLTDLLEGRVRRWALSESGAEGKQMVYANAADVQRD